jgi:hypothetical protein
MSPTRNFALALTLATTAILPASAGSSGKYDGNWAVSVVTEKGSCDAYKWTLVVSGSRLLRIDEMPLSASGSIDARGQARFQVASMVNADGQMQDSIGSGRWDAPSRSCSGRWRAARL